MWFWCLIKTDGTKRGCVIVTCGELSSTETSQSFNIGYASGKYCLAGYIIGNNSFLKEQGYVSNLSLNQNGTVTITRTGAGFYSGQILKVLLIYHT